MGVGVCKVIPIAVGIYFYIHANSCVIYLTGRRTGFIGWNQLWVELESATVLDFYTWTFFQAVGNIFPMSF
ncbi:hypothetical protein HK100_009447, partial [Physocladia obscura]